MSFVNEIYKRRLKQRLHDITWLGCNNIVLIATVPARSAGKETNKVTEGRVTGEDSLDSEWSIGQDKPRVQQVCVADSLSIVCSTARGIHTESVWRFSNTCRRARRPAASRLDVTREIVSGVVRESLSDFARNCASGGCNGARRPHIETPDIPPPPPSRYLSIQYVNRAPCLPGTVLFYGAAGRPRANKVIVPWWIWTFARLITRVRVKKCYRHTGTMSGRSQKRAQI